MRVIAELAYILHTVTGSLSGSECGSGNIYGIGTAVDGRDADILILGRSEKFKVSHLPVKFIC